MTNYPSLEQLSALLGVPDEEQRRLAVLELHRFSPANSRSLLLMALGDSSWRVRKEATVVLLAGTCDRELVGMLVTALGADSNAGLRNAAVETLVALGAPALPVLVESLRDADGDTRKFIVDIFGTIDNADSRAALEMLLADPDLNVATAAAESLGRLAAPESLPALVRALECPSLWFRYAVLEAIAAIGKPVAAPVVSSLAGDRLLRGAVFDCLGAIGDFQAVPLLLEGLDEATPRLMMSAAQSLVRVRELLGDAERDDLDRKLKNTAGTPLPLRLGIRVDGGDGGEALVKLLGIIGDPCTAGSLVRACRDPRLRPHCAEALKKMADDVGPELARQYAQGEPEGRAGILWLCGEVAFAGSVDLLHRGSSDRSETVRAAAMSAASGCDDAALLPVLASGCVDPSPEVREEAFLSLLRLAERFPDRAGTVAEELAGSPEVCLRRVAARLCSLSGTGDGVERLLRDEDPLVRSAAVSGLKRRAPATALGHLTLLLTDEDAGVRTVAAGVLGEIGGESAFEPLLAALGDEESDVVCAALHSLAEQGARAFTPVLETARRSGGMVLLAALESLDRIDPLRAGGVLEECLDHEDDPYVRRRIQALRDGLR